MRNLIAGLCAALTLCWSLPVLAAPSTQIVGPNGTAASVDSHGLQVDCTNGCGGGGGGGGGFDSGPVVASQTPANSSHAAGTSIGGLFTIPVVRTAGGSGALTQFALTSVGGSTGQYVVRIWQKSPTNTTCTDNTAFAGNFATDDASLITPPFTVSPIAVTNTTGDSATYAALTNLNWDYKNGDATQNLYVCLVAVATNTADDNHAVRVMLSGPQN